MARQFHLGDVLTITHGRLVSPRHMDGVYDILNYMTGDNLFTHQLPRAAGICRPHLLAQHPELDSPEMTFQIGRLVAMLESESGKAESKELIDGWLFTLTLEYGEMLSVEPLRPADYEYVDPVEEAEAMIGKDRVISI